MKIQGRTKWWQGELFVIKQKLREKKMLTRNFGDKFQKLMQFVIGNETLVYPQEPSTMVKNPWNECLRVSAEEAKEAITLLLCEKQITNWRFGTQKGYY